MNRAQIKALCVMVTAFAAASITHTWGVSEFMKISPYIPIVCIVVCVTLIAIIEEDR